MDKTVKLPDHYAPRIDTALQRLGTRLDDPKSLATAVLKLSDFYIAKPDAPTPWDQSWAKIAYLCYFFPLNYLRVQGVFKEAQRLGFLAGITRYTDFGSGVGTVSTALDDMFPGQFNSGIAIERSHAAMGLHKELQGPGATPLVWNKTAGDPLRSDKQFHLSCFSYALTEVQRIPGWAHGSAALAIIEPATHQDGRRLQGWRADLQKGGWHVWAPCTHAEACPLLEQSGRDWCHDRVHWEAPAWFAAIEEHLPMHNASLTYSYLLMRRTPPPAALAGLARLTGDLKREKGASRQLVCRGPKREFLSWQNKHGEAPEFPRGALVRIPEGVVAKSNELRPMPGDVSLVEALPPPEAAKD